MKSLLLGLNHRYRIGQKLTNIQRHKRWDFSQLSFLASSLFLAIGYGMAAAHFSLFPYPQIVDAKTAFVALSAIEDDRLVAGLARIDKNAAATPTITTLAPGAGNELLLVTGGAFQNMQSCPKFGCIAWIINRKGEVLHHWEVDFAEIFADLKGFSGEAAPTNFYPVGMTMLGDGSIVVSFHGRNIFPYHAGIAKISRDGKILWKKLDYGHHWLTSDANGLIYTPSSQLVQSQKYFGGSAVKARCKGVLYTGGVRIYAPDGTLKHEFQMLDALDRAGYRGLLYALRDDCDPIHLNSVDVADAKMAGHVTGMVAGDLLVSMREPDAVAILDGKDGHIKYLISGRTAGQHSPQFMPDGTAMVFDNLGGDRSTGGSRIARLNFTTGVVETVYPRPDNPASLPLFSSDSGHISISPDGKRMMLAVKDQMQDIEVNIETGTPLWKMTKSYDVTPYLLAIGSNSGAKNAYFKHYGTYYLTEERFRAAGLGQH